MGFQIPKNKEIFEAFHQSQKFFFTEERCLVFIDLPAKGLKYQ